MTTNTGNGPKASHLSDPRYGYDAVLGISQASLNDNVNSWISNDTHPKQVLFWCEGNNGEFIGSTTLHIVGNKGADPMQFTQDNHGPSEDRKRYLYHDLGFRLAVSSTLGRNTKTPDVSVPPKMIDFTPDGQIAIIQPIWQDITLISLDANLNWRVFTQDPALPWTIHPSVKVNEVTRTILNTPFVNRPANAPTSTIPPTSTAEAPAFRIPTLLLDLVHPLAWNISTHDDVPPEINNKLGKAAKDILTVAFSNAPLPLSSIISRTTPWSFPLSNYTYMINHYVDSSGRAISQPNTGQRQATTLNYVCGKAVDGKDPSLQPFSWNWIEADQVNPYHGVFALNRDVLRDYIDTKIRSQVQNSYILVQPKISIVSGKPRLRTVYTATFLSTPVNMEASKPDGKTQVLYYYWVTEPTAPFGDLGFDVFNEYRCSVDFQNNEIIVRQIAQCDITVTYIGRSTPPRGRAVLLQQVDTYTLTIDQFGGLSWAVSHESIDEPPDSAGTQALRIIRENGGLDFAGEMKKKLHEVFTPIKWGLNQSTSATPAAILPPGGTFSCANARFSDHQDLIVNLTYALTCDQAMLA